MVGAWLLLAARRKPAPPQPPAPIPVVTALAQAGDVPIYLEGIGTVQPYNSVTVRAQVDGTLDRITFVEGQQGTARTRYGAASGGLGRYS